MSWLEETVTCMDEDPLLGWGLKPVELADQAILTPFFSSLADPLSDYTFSQLFTWRNSLRILWTILHGNLCVFANGSGDLTLLMPPIGPSDSDRALAEAFDLMHTYNHAKGVGQRTRVEYASEELLGRFQRGKIIVQPLGTDYIYDVTRMIDLAGGDLASKRQAKNRFMRNYRFDVQPYDPAHHLDDCRQLLGQWKQHQDSQHAAEMDVNAIKRAKESLACELTLQYAEALGLRGMVVYCAPADQPAAPMTLRGFTFGEKLGNCSSSIVIEKTDLEAKGLAQFIFSEFCRCHWADRPLVNVGDDWGLESLAWTKSSYRPIKLLQKYVLTPQPTAMISLASPVCAAPLAAASATAAIAMASPLSIAPPAVIAPPAAQMQSSAQPLPLVRAATKADVAAAVCLEQSCFSAHNLSKRQLMYLQQRPSAVFLVAEEQGAIIGEGISLLRKHRRNCSGRIYSLAVSKVHRGRKLGRRLLTDMLNELKNRGATRVYLEVERSNTAAISLYQQFGFVDIGVLPDYYGPGKDGRHMLCRLEAQAVEANSAETQVVQPQAAVAT